jgi:hypothetical protein
MEQSIGSCSLCGGDVVGHVGAWWSVLPPPPARCTSCGARAATGPVIPMVPASPQREQSVTVTTAGSCLNQYAQLRNAAGNLCMQLGRNWSGPR